ncbi:bestrophin-1-like [Pollicipes pollicipes]|uniref:bestrophin-1-like n=1 Tax=Pollicipes pollicipes TaxID=41117 RepID=UPI00188576A1|nr:bestrophin-1-like [Pollicipes pollicipes]
MTDTLRVHDDAQHVPIGVLAVGCGVELGLTEPHHQLTGRHADQTDLRPSPAYCNTFINLIPLSFVLGFYVSFVAQRWWQQYMAIPWPDNDPPLSDVWPTLEHLVESGFMTATELEEFSSVPRKEFNTYWIPCCWFVSLLREARITNHVIDSQGLKLIVETFNEYRANCGLLWSYDWVSIPLVYTQVVTIATYAFFVACLVGRQQEAGQTLHASDAGQLDLYIPLFTVLQFLFYMGLLKVAEQLINPFGDDDEDFELNWIIDRHVKVSYLIVDSLNVRRPPLVKDMYFDDPGLTLPYTEASVQYKIPTYRGSVDSMKVPERQHTMVLPEIKEEQDESGDEDGAFFGSTSLGSIAAENGMMDGRDPRVGAVSVPDEALLSGPQSHLLQQHGPLYHPDPRPLYHPDPTAEPQLSATSSTSDEAVLRRHCLAPSGGAVERHTSMSAPNRAERRLPKRSVSWQSPHLIPARWRRRQRAEVIWHPLPDIQRANTSSLERKHSLPAPANKRVQIVAPSELDELPGRTPPPPPAPSPSQRRIDAQQQAHCKRP